MQLGLIGRNINYSISPALYQYWFNKYSIDDSYVLLDIDKLTYELFYHWINNGFFAFNITQPYKTVIISLLKDKLHLTQRAIKFNSINNIYVQDNTIIGDNTDYNGFMSTLSLVNTITKNILVIGAGGVIKPILQSLFDFYDDIEKVFLYNRTIDKALELKNDFKKLKVIDNLNNIDIRNIDLIINTTTLKITDNNLIDENLYNQISDDSTIIDLKYNYTITKNNFINGYNMLIEQARYNFKLWYNIFPESIPYERLIRL